MDLRANSPRAIEFEFEFNDEDFDVERFQLINDFIIYVSQRVFCESNHIFDEEIE